ncbi:hypothetical protein GCM10023116_43510 [Kistimonas scapharcae]|uniref:Lysozyme n=1 Tax=Kistimonas scapharcae TaxID=1036133 RepID=A0ABP8VAT0_9GAMM
MDATDLIKLHEGCRLKPYRCTANKLTIGWGRNLDDNGIDQEEADFMLDSDVIAVEKELGSNLSWFCSLDEVRQAVLTDMCFNLGWPRLSAFKKTLQHIEGGHYELAAIEMLNSKWARQVKNRAARLSEMMQSGKWPEVT